MAPEDGAMGSQGKISGKRWPRIVFAVLLALALGEFALRALGAADPRRAKWLEPLQLGAPDEPAYQPGGELLYRYPSDPRGAFDATGSVHGRINSLGLRGPEVSRAKRAGTQRIAVLGDSFTLGIGVQDEQTLPAQLELMLGSREIEVLNFGVSSSDSLDQVRYLEGYVSSFAPQLALIVFFLNDAERAPTMDYLVSPQLLPELRAHSHLLHGTLRLIEGPARRREFLAHYREGYNLGSDSWLRLCASLRRAREYTAAQGMQLVLAIHPVLFELERGRYPFAAIHAQLMELCASEQIPALDLFDTLADTPADQLWVHPSDRHPNELCHARTARALARFLRRQKLVRPR